MRAIRTLLLMLSFAVAVILVLTGVRVSDADPANLANRLKGTYAANTTGFCYITASSGGTLLNNQYQGQSGTYYFDGAGGFTIEILVNSFNISTGTLSTSTVTATGTYAVSPDNSVTTEVASNSLIIDGAGTGNTVHVPSITGRWLIVGDELFRMPTTPPAEETVITTLAGGGGTTTTYRKCSRVGTLHKI